MESHPPDANAVPPDTRGRWFGPADLSGVDLRGLDLTRTDLQKARLAHAHAEGVVAHGARLRRANLAALHGRGLAGRDADLEGALLSEADLREADLQRAILLEARLNGADLRGADLRGADLRHADLRGADLRGARFDHSDLTGAHLAGALVEGVSAFGACINRADDGGTDALKQFRELGAYTGLHPMITRAGSLTSVAGRRLARSARNLRARTSAGTETLQEQGLDRAADVFAQIATRRADARVRREREKEAATARREARLEAIRARRQAESDARERARQGRIRRRVAASAERQARRDRRRAPASRLLVAPPPTTPTLDASAPPSREEQRIATLQRMRDAERSSGDAVLQVVQEAAIRSLRTREATETSRRAAARARVEAEAAERKRLAELAAAAKLEAEHRAQEEAAQREAARVRAAAQAEARLLAQAEAERKRAHAQQVAIQRARQQVREGASIERDLFASRPSHVSTLRQRERAALEQSRVRPQPATSEPNTLQREHRPLPPVLLRQDADRVSRIAKLLRRESERRHSDDVPIGPGADLRGVDFTGRRFQDVKLQGADLREARLNAARLDGADLSEAKLQEASLEGARLNRSNLRGANLSNATLDGIRLQNSEAQDSSLTEASLIDADLRGADLRDADLRGANLTGADLRRCLLDGADLTGANLTACRLSDLDLTTVRLDGVNLDQADLAGTRLVGASVTGANIGGALGLSGRDRARLTEAGARTSEAGFDGLIEQVAPRQLRYAAAVLALGVGAWFAARYLADGNLDPALLESEAEALRVTDPLQASATYVELADESLRVDDRVGYLIEAAVLAEVGGEVEQAETLLMSALEAGADSPGLTGDVRLRLGEFLDGQERWSDLSEQVAPLLSGNGFPAETRARAVLLVRTAAVQLHGHATSEAESSLFASLAELPEAEADLRIALARMYAARGEEESGLNELAAARDLNLPTDLFHRIAETRASVLDQAGQTDAAAAVWEDLMVSADPASPPWQRARLALADLRHRQGDYEAAQELLEALTATTVEDSVRGRALLVGGRIAENVGDLSQAATLYREVLRLTETDDDTDEDARLSLARILLSGDSAVEAAALAALPPDAAAGIMAHARVGEARSHLDAGDAASALEIFEDLANDPNTPTELSKSARSGEAEALARLGELEAAVTRWRALLDEDPTPEERVDLELQLAHGLLQGGDTKEAGQAFRSLASSEVDDIRFQGLLGVAEVARAEGETEKARTVYQQVADQSTDRTYQVHALQELADLATEQGRPQDALIALRAIITAAAPGSGATADARVALILTLDMLGETDEALLACEQAARTATEVALRAQVALACGELLERRGDPERARSQYATLLALVGVDPDLRADAWLGQARTAMASGDPRATARTFTAALAEVEAPALRLPLLAAQVNFLRRIEAQDALQQAVAERDALAADVPALAGPVLVDSALSARARGDLGPAVELLRKAVALPLSDAARAGALIELGDTLLEKGNQTDARVVFEQALDVDDIDESTRFAAEMGLAETIRRSGDLAAASELISALEAPDPTSEEWLLETRARVLTELDQTEDAQAAWEALVQATTEGSSTQTRALRGRADLLLGDDQPAAALAVYEEALASAVEPAEAGWSRLGIANAHRMLGRDDEAAGIFDELTTHSEPEVALQARLMRAQMLAEQEDWSATLARLEGADAHNLGPGWDASLVELAASAHLESGDHDAAKRVWTELAERWPVSEEAILPAWLGLADVARLTGDFDKARALANQALERAKDPGYRQRAEDLVQLLGG